jgi:hypothetical protein
MPMVAESDRVLDAQEGRWAPSGASDSRFILEGDPGDVNRARGSDTPATWLGRSHRWSVRVIGGELDIVDHEHVSSPWRGWGRA